jgi:hypothetical protein
MGGLVPHPADQSRCDHDPPVGGEYRGDRHHRRDGDTDPPRGDRHINAAPDMFDSSPDPEARSSPECTRAIDHRRRFGRDVVGVAKATRLRGRRSVRRANRGRSPRGCPAGTWLVLWDGSAAQIRRRGALGVPAASNSGATSPIAAHSRLVLIAARGNHPHRALTQVRRISPRGTV